MPNIGGHFPAEFYIDWRPQQQDKVRADHYFVVVDKLYRVIAYLPEIIAAKSIQTINEPDVLSLTIPYNDVAKSVEFGNYIQVYSQTSLVPLQTYTITRRIDTTKDSIPIVHLECQSLLYNLQREIVYNYAAVARTISTHITNLLGFQIGTQIQKDVLHKVLLKIILTLLQMIMDLLLKVMLVDIHLYKQLELEHLLKDMQKILDTL